MMIQFAVHRSSTSGRCTSDCSHCFWGWRSLNWLTCDPRATRDEVLPRPTSRPHDWTLLRWPPLWLTGLLVRSSSVTGLVQVRFGFSTAVVFKSWGSGTVVIPQCDSTTILIEVPHPQHYYNPTSGIVTTRPRTEQKGSGDLCRYMIEQELEFFWFNTVWAAILYCGVVWSVVTGFINWSEVLCGIQLSVQCSEQVWTNIMWKYSNASGTRHYPSAHVGDVGKHEGQTTRESIVFFHVSDSSITRVNVIDTVRTGTVGPSLDAQSFGHLMKLSFDRPR